MVINNRNSLIDNLFLKKKNCMFTFPNKLYDSRDKIFFEL